MKNVNLISILVGIVIGFLTSFLFFSNRAAIASSTNKIIAEDSAIYDQDFFVRYEQILREEFLQNALIKKNKDAPNSPIVRMDSTKGEFINHSDENVQLKKELYRFWRDDIQLNSNKYLPYSFYIGKKHFHKLVKMAKAYNRSAIGDDKLAGYNIHMAFTKKIKQQTDPRGRTITFEVYELDPFITPTTLANKSLYSIGTSTGSGTSRTTSTQSSSLNHSIPCPDVCP